jgi:acyl-CoA synthetase (AMP-forming)/AMP-acid ligase II
MPHGPALIGEDLWDFLSSRRITALCCVPTLLATLDRDLTELRFLLVSGEACPPALIGRWHWPGWRLLNVYGPTEATVTAIWVDAGPGRAMTIGAPLPTYSVVILDPAQDRALAGGGIGEIGIAGIGLARGYVNRDDLTRRAFLPDFLGLPGNPGGRIYRTGDLGRITDQGKIEYLGRVDTQVKIRGYRVELAEIESVLLELPGVAQAVVRVLEPRPRDPGTGGLLHPRPWSARARPRLRWHPTARTAAGVHDPELPGRALLHSDAPVRQGGPEGASAANQPARPRPGRGDRASLHRSRTGAGRAASQGHGAGAGLGPGSLLRRDRR